MLFRYGETKPKGRSFFSHAVTAGVRGVGGEVKRKAVDQGYLEGWLAGWLALAGFGCGGRLTNLQRRRMGF